MPEPADTAAAITATLADDAAELAADRMIEAIRTRFNLAPGVRTDLAADPTTHDVLRELIATAISDEAPAIIEAALAGWTPP